MCRIKTCSEHVITHVDPKRPSRFIICPFCYRFYRGCTSTLKKSEQLEKKTSNVSIVSGVYSNFSSLNFLELLEFFRNDSVLCKVFKLLLFYYTSDDGAIEFINIIELWNLNVYRKWRVS